MKSPFPWLHYDDAIKLIQSKGSETQWGSDFGGTDETIIAEAYDRPVVVHRFPTQIKAFYMEPDPERPELTLSADILAPEGYGEIVGGGERMSSAELLLQRIHEHQLPEEAFRWYVDLRRYGSVPHAGFGMGIERLVTWICGLEHLRETIAFPRMLYRIYPQASAARSAAAGGGAGAAAGVAGGRGKNAAQLVEDLRNEDEAHLRRRPIAVWSRWARTR